jgi:hypothetical protein
MTGLMLNKAIDDWSDELLVEADKWRNGAKCDYV